MEPPTPPESRERFPVALSGDAAARVGPPEPGVPYPVCLAGERAGPPDDCGGISGYYDMLEAVANPDHEDHEAMTEWLGPDFDPEAFASEVVNELLALLG